MMYYLHTYPCNYTTGKYIAEVYLNSYTLSVVVIALKLPNRHIVNVDYWLCTKLHFIRKP